MCCYYYNTLNYNTCKSCVNLLKITKNNHGRVIMVVTFPGCWKAKWNREINSLSKWSRLQLGVPYILDLFYVHSHVIFCILAGLGCVVADSSHENYSPQMKRKNFKSCRTIISSGMYFSHSESYWIIAGCIIYVFSPSKSSSYFELLLL